MNFFLCVFAAAFMAGALTPPGIDGSPVPTEDVRGNQTPRYLYKVLSSQAWEESQSQPLVILSDDDAAFIHFSTEGQLERITSKYWSGVPEYVVLIVDTDLLPGNMVYEANPGGANKYYHLYGGSIPLMAVIKADIVESGK